MVGTSSINLEGQLKVGDTNVQKIYIGDTVIYYPTPTPTPTPTNTPTPTPTSTSTPTPTPM